VDSIIDFFFTVVARFTDLRSRFAIPYLLVSAFIVYVLWLRRGRPISFFTYLFPKAVYLHKSNWVDIKVFLFNALLTFVGVFAVLSMVPLVTHTVLDALLSYTGTRAEHPDPTWVRLAIATVIMILTLDFCKYWAHRIHHETEILWPFHAVHHSAEIMTPLTAARNHPVFLIIRGFIYTFIVGAVQGLMLFLLMGEIELITIGTVNAGYFIFNVVGSNLRHSHVWLSYGPILEHIFISPAQHHIHHSIERKHYNKNYGEVFAFWDWMFGTLYVLRHYEEISYGLADENGERIEQPHPDLRSAMVRPFVESWQALTTRTPKHPEPKSPPKS
jgi:sterol desaturase/sphingolipid hydroxylase (fatty acid hydroxylase superfamily)